MKHLFNIFCGVMLGAVLPPALVLSFGYTDLVEFFGALSFTAGVLLFVQPLWKLADYLESKNNLLK